MSFSSLISRSVIQRLNLYNSLFCLSNSSHFSTLLYFYFPFYPSPLILLKSKLFIFPFSCFVVQWVVCSPFFCAIPFGYHVSLLFTPSLSLALSVSCSLTVSWLPMQRLWQKLTPTVTVALANEEFRVPGPATTESSHASINVTQNFLPHCFPWTLYRRCTFILPRSQGIKTVDQWHWRSFTNDTCKTCTAAITKEGKLS